MGTLSSETQYVVRPEHFDWEHLDRASHTLVGMAAQIGAMALWWSVFELNRHIRSIRRAAEADETVDPAKVREMVLLLEVSSRRHTLARKILFQRGLLATEDPPEPSPAVE